MDAIELKKALRRQMKAAKASLSEDEKTKAAASVAEQIMANQRIKESQNIVAYWSMDDELPTHELVDLLAQTHRVYLPVMVGDDLELRRYEGRESLQREPQYGIEEPTSTELLADNAEKTTIIVPGVAFTLGGQRLGRGRGFYDRMLKKQGNAHKIGIAFGCQIVGNLPTEAHDYVMDEVLMDMSV